MPPSSRPLRRALLLSVGIHLGLGVWLWTRDEPEPPPAEALQVPLTLQLMEIEVPPRATPPQPGVSAPTPSPRALALPSPRRSSPRLPETADAPAPPGAQGGVSPYFSTLGWSVLQHWAPEHLLALEGFEGTFALNPSAHREVARVVADARDQRALRWKTKARLRASRHTTVRVLQDVRGKPLLVTVVSSSHDRHLDIAAAEDVRRAVARQPPLSPEVAQGRELWVSHWRLELLVAEGPPEPATGLSFDAELTPTEFHLPPDQHLYKRVRLLEARTCGAGAPCFKQPGE